MDVIVFGAGGVGLGLGSALLAGGARVRLIGRPETVAALRTEGLRRSGLLGEALAKPGQLEAATGLAELSSKAADFLLVCVKSFDSAEVAAAIAAASQVGPETHVVLCQNGWGNVDHFAATVDPARLWNARVITGFRRPEPGHVQVTAHAEPVHIGSLAGEDPRPVEPLCAAIQAGGLPCETTGAIARDLWAKLLYNGLLNPLGAIFGVAYGELGDSAHAREVMAGVAGEIFGVMRAAGHETHWDSPEAYLEDFYARLLPPTAAHESSTLLDLRAGRRTEIDAILGAVVREGERHGAEAPTCAALAAMVHFLEKRTD